MPALPALPARDEPVRVVARHPDGLPAGVRERVEVEGSHADPVVIDRALDDAARCSGWWPVT